MDAGSEAAALRRLCFRFVLKLCLYWGAGLLLVTRGLNEAMCRATAENLALLLNAAGFACSLAGKALHVGTVNIEIIPGCTSVLPTVLLGGAILAFPTTPYRKALGLVLAVASLWVFNLMRVLALMVVLAFRPDAFDLVHVYVWRVLTSLVILGFFVTWGNRPLSVARAAR